MAPATQSSSTETGGGDITAAIPGWFVDVEKGWPGEALCFKVEKILFQGKSKYQDILVFQSASHGKVVMVDGSIQLTEKDEFAYQEMMTHLPLCSIPDPKRVLLIGGGDGGILAEASRHSSLKTIDICELDQLVIDVYKDFFPEIAIGYSDPRVRLHMGDGIEFLKATPKGTYDAIILDAFTSMGPDGDVIEEESFLRAVASALRAGGVMCSPAESLWNKHFNLAKTLTKCRKFFKGSVNYAWSSVPSYSSFKSGMIGYMLCSTGGPSVDFKHPINPLIQDHLGVAKRPPKFYNSEVHAAAFCLPPFAKGI